MAGAANNDARDNDSFLWSPPQRKTSLCDDYMYPFSTQIIQTNIPDGLKQSMTPPVSHLLDLSYPQVTPKPGTLTKRTTTTPTPTTNTINNGSLLIDEASSPLLGKEEEEREPPFGSDLDASQLVRAEDVDQALGFRTALFPGYATAPANASLHSNFPPIHRLSYDDQRKISHYNTPVRSRALVAATSTDILHWAHCNQETMSVLNLDLDADDDDDDDDKTSEPKQPDRHCEKDGVFQSRDFGELGESERSYPPEIRCWENAHSRLVI